MRRGSAAVPLHRGGFGRSRASVAWCRVRPASHANTCTGFIARYQTRSMWRGAAMLTREQTAVWRLRVQQPQVMTRPVQISGRWRLGFTNYVALLSRADACLADVWPGKKSVNNNAAAVCSAVQLVHAARYGKPTNGRNLDRTGHDTRWVWQKPL